MQPKVSIALRTCNQKEFLRETVDSILIQDYENMEIVVADDASTDGTQELLREFDRKHPGLFKLFFNKRILGNPANANVVLSGCTGKYIAWLDGDDVFLPEKIKKQVAFMERHPKCVICYPNAEMFYDNDPEKVQNVYGTGPDQFLPLEGGVEILFEDFFVLLGAAMVRRDACPGKWDTQLSRGTDALYVFETAMKGEIRYMPEVLMRYRRHKKSITHTLSPEEWKTYCYLIYALIDAKYPQFCQQVRQKRDFAKDVYLAAVKKIKAGQNNEGRKLFWESLRHGWVSWKWFGWYVRSFLKF